MKLLLACLPLLVLCFGHDIPISLEDFSPRIVNGIVANPGQFPWQVLLIYQRNTSHYMCGGSLINNEWILTAGHCVYQSHNFKVYLGRTRLNETEDGSLERGTIQQIVHPEYNDTNLNNDIALLKLNSPVEYTNRIRNVQLVHSNEIIPHNASVVISGWGRLGPQLPSSPWLYFTTMRTDSARYCSGQPQESIICTVSESSSTAGGDSGGALVRFNANREAVQVGIASAAVDGFYSPNVFARVAVFIDFINLHTGLNLP